MGSFVHTCGRGCQSPTVFKSFVKQIIVTKLVPIVAAHFVLKAMLDAAKGETRWLRLSPPYS